MSSKLERNEISNTIQISSSLEHCNDQDHHPKAAAFIDQRTHSPIMNQRTKRPLSTYTSLGSPIHRTTGLFAAPRKLSIGYETPSSPLLSKMQGRSRSNSQSTVVTGIPSLFLPLQQSSFDDFVHVQPSVDATMRTSEEATYGVLDNHNKVIEATHVSEKKRATELENEERNMTSDELRQVLKRERVRTAKIQADLQVALLRYNDLMSNHKHHYNQPSGELSDADRMQQKSLTRRKRKFEIVECSKKN